MTLGHTAPQRIRLWWLLDRCFGSTDIFADSFHICRSIHRPPSQRALSIPLPQHCVALLRLGHHCAPAGESVLLQEIPIGTPVRKSNISVDNRRNDSVNDSASLPPTSGVVILILATCQHSLELPDCNIATAPNNTYPGLCDVRHPDTDRLTSVVLADPKNLLHSQLLVSLSHPTGYFSRNENDCEFAPRQAQYEPLRRQ